MSVCVDGMNCEWSAQNISRSWRPTADHLLLQQGIGDQLLVSLVRKGRSVHRTQPPLARVSLLCHDGGTLRWSVLIGPQDDWILSGDRRRPLAEVGAPGARATSTRSVAWKVLAPSARRCDDKGLTKSPAFPRRASLAQKLARSGIVVSRTGRRASWT